MNPLSKRIKDKREKERLSAEELAQMLTTADFKVTKENVYKWERGSKPSEMEVYQRIVNWLDNADKSISIGKVVQEGSETITIPLKDFLAEIREKKEMAERYNDRLEKIIIAQLTNLDSKLTAAGKNLDAALAGVFQQSIKMDAMGSTVLDSLTRLEKKKPGELVHEAGKRQREMAKELLQQGTTYVVNK